MRLLDDLGNARRLVELTQAAETAGFDMVWFPGDAFRLHSGAMLAAASQVTNSIGLGWRANPYTSDPSETAGYVATLDYLSQGRAVLGVGLHTTQMLEWVGVQGEDAVERTRECVEVVEAILGGARGPHDGRHYKTTSDAFLRFAPYRSAVPTYIAAVGPEYLELSGAIGNGSLPMVAPPEAASLLVADIARGAADAGRPLSDVDVAAFVWIWLSEGGSARSDRLADVIAYFGEYLEERVLAAVGLSREAFAPISARLRAGDKA
ncbi:MAG: LLM class flavin-dependent oxidoreductase, partial [Solirubrobacteraceae bacterium]